MVNFDHLAKIAFLDGFAENVGVLRYKIGET
jgi:hypothetical protein